MCLKEMDKAGVGRVDELRKWAGVQTSKTGDGEQKDEMSRQEKGVGQITGGQGVLADCIRTTANTRWAEGAGFLTKT